MFDKLEDTLLRYEEVLNELSEPDVLNDQSRYQKLMKEQRDPSGRSRQRSLRRSQVG